MKWTDSERARIVELYFRNRCNVRATQRPFRQVSRLANVASGNVIRRFVAHFRKKGSVADKKRSGRQRNVTSQGNLAAVSDSVNRSPNKPVRRRSAQLEMSKSSLHRVLRDRLQLHAYKVQLVQKLQRGDSERRLSYSRAFLRQFRGTWATNGYRLIMSDEASSISVDS